MSILRCRYLQCTPLFTSEKMSTSDYLDLTSNPKELKTSLTGKVILGITGTWFCCRFIKPTPNQLAILGGLGLGISLICFPFVSPALRRHCLPYVPATTQQIRNVIGALKHEKRHGLLMDIGAGDGRIVIESAKAKVCTSGHGVELNRWLVYYSRWMAYRNGVGSTTKFFKKDLWKYDLSPYNQIVIFGVEEMVSGSHDYHHCPFN